MKKNIYLLLLLTLSLTACNDILDETPDPRTEIDTPEKVAKLLTSGYPVSIPAALLEYSGDNLVDNNVCIAATHKAAYQDWLDEAYAWEDVRNYQNGAQDTPYTIWEAYYQGIAVCNHAIRAMEEMSDDPRNDKTLSASWGEAHVLRAYLHFTLAMVFAEAYKDEEQSKNDLAIPYVTVPEEVVNVNYGTPEWRKSVTETYQLIEKDLLEGIDLINDASYAVPAYHFNKNAAYAFAARFYLARREYEKVIKYADMALGANPAAMLRKWMNINTNTFDTRLKDYNNEEAPCNFLIQSTYSLQNRYLSALRYCINDGSKDWGVPSTTNILMMGSGPNWSGMLECFKSNLYIFGEQQYGVWPFFAYEYFEYKDKIAGIGYVHIIYHPLTADETLLCRAEAKLYLGQTDDAISDMNFWTATRGCEKDLSRDNIKKFYSAKAQKDFLSDIHPAEMSPEFKTFAAGSDEYYTLQCLLHFRRIETVFEGLRWFDIKRYGITVYHAYRGPMEDDVHQDWLQWNDPRRVLQIPNSVIAAGYPATDRTTTPLSDGGNNDMVAVPYTAE